MSEEQIVSNCEKQPGWPGQDWIGTGSISAKDGPVEVPVNNRDGALPFSSPAMFRSGLKVEWLDARDGGRMSGCRDVGWWK